MNMSVFALIVRIVFDVFLHVYFAVYYLPHWRLWEVMFIGMHICLWTTSWHKFKSDCHHTLSDIPLASRDEVRIRSVREVVCAVLNF